MKEKPVIVRAFCCLRENSFFIDTFFLHVLVSLGKLSDIDKQSATMSDIADL